MDLYTFSVSLFTLSEVLLLILKRSKKTTAKKQNDGGSLLLLWVIITGCIAAGYVIAVFTRLGKMPGARYLLFPGEGIGLSAIVIGFVIRWVAIYQLGNMFTVDVAISSAHILKTDGIYKIARHPSYLGLMLIIAGLAFLMDNVLSCIVVIVPVFFVMNYRMKVEEKALEGEFGEQYVEYKQKVKKIIPLIY